MAVAIFSCRGGVVGGVSYEDLVLVVGILGHCVYCRGGLCFIIIGDERCGVVIAEGVIFAIGFVLIE